eukprot:CAMPEP_0114658034 /NCGR_PEP_ID=MMETSP0191-20121206/14986_1 /TAXON_ID=126664 /ORGANISM="Sorites sp." /LENGTH=79 /DNA_ID=CAMNT_0001878937 /DNA_START=466 /DNA_END=705 /DNA_ORIENTATION=-
MAAIARIRGVSQDDVTTYSNIIKTFTPTPSNTASGNVSPFGKQTGNSPGIPRGKSPSFRSNTSWADNNNNSNQNTKSNE